MPARVVDMFIITADLAETASVAVAKTIGRASGFIDKNSVSCHVLTSW